MFILGVRFEIAPANLRRLGLGAAGGASEKPAADQAVFAPGDIVVANFTNVFEVNKYIIFLPTNIHIFRRFALFSLADFGAGMLPQKSYFRIS
jgi:hypothetical protein